MRGLGHSKAEPLSRRSVVHDGARLNIFLHMGNRFGALVHLDDVRWAAAEGVSETVIAAVLLLHHRSVDEIAPELGVAELEQVIKLARRTCDAPQRPAKINHRDVVAEKQLAGSPGADTRCWQETPTSARPDAADDRRSQNAETTERRQTGVNGPKSGTLPGTRNETARRRLIVEDLMKAGLSIRMISEVTDIPRSSVHRAMRAVARAEAKKEVAIAEIAAKLLGKKLSHRGRGRA